MTTTNTVRGAFAASDQEYLKKCLRQRNPGSDALGSTFSKPLTLDELTGADWQPYEHADVQSPAVAFKAPIPGTFGLVRLDSLGPDTIVVLRDPKEIGKVDATVPGAPLAEVDFTVLLLGPKDEGSTEMVVWTFFPGEPVRPSQVDVNMESGIADGAEITAADAIGLGFVWAKLAG